jgi:hypothetical protein
VIFMLEKVEAKQITLKRDGRTFVLKAAPPSAESMHISKTE